MVCQLSGHVYPTLRKAVASLTDLVSALSKKWLWMTEMNGLNQPKLPTSHPVTGNVIKGYSNGDSHTLQLQFLIRPGAEVSMLLRRICAVTHPSCVCLYSATDFSIKTYGQKQLTLNLDLGQPVTWIFVVGYVTTDILGADFLTHITNPNRYSRPYI